jgi:fimbrial chaperone protein
MIARSFLLGTLMSVATWILPPTPVQAGTFSVSPLRVDLTSKVRTGALTIRNQRDSEVAVEAQGMLWEQVDGQDRLTPTRDVLVSPVVFSLPANGSQLVRVALQRHVDADRELSYRLILTEVPPQASPGFTGLNVALRLSLPIFVEPVAATQPNLEWSATRGNGEQLGVTARNTGGAHTRVLNLSVAPLDDPETAIVQQTAAYILPGQSRTWLLNVNQKDGTSGTEWRPLRVNGITESGGFAAEISSEGR